MLARKDLSLKKKKRNSNVGSINYSIREYDTTSMRIDGHSSDANTKVYVDGSAVFFYI